MKTFVVKFTHVIERHITCEVEAETAGQAIEKARECDWIDSDEEFAPDEGIETKNYRVLEVRD